MAMMILTSLDNHLGRDDKSHVGELNEMLYGATITACQRAGMGNECLRLLATMVGEGVNPNLSVYNIVLGALCSGGGKQLDKAVQLLALMASGKTKSPLPDIQSYTQVGGWVGLPPLSSSSSSFFSSKDLVVEVLLLSGMLRSPIGDQCGDGGDRW